MYPRYYDYNDILCNGQIITTTFGFSLFVLWCIVSYIVAQKLFVLWQKASTQETIEMKPCDQEQVQVEMKPSDQEQVVQVQIEQAQVEQEQVKRVQFVQPE